MNRAILRSIYRSSNSARLSQRLLSTGVRSSRQFSTGAVGQKVMLGAGLGLATSWMMYNSWDNVMVSNEADKEKVETERLLVENSAGGSDVKVAEGKPETTASDEKSKTSQEQTGETAEEGEAPQGAYNPETGEINWDCPCLGGMAHGPCGEEFKEAFACFIYSETEPRGIDCIKKFENMRSCFKRYPDHYKEELLGDDEPEGAPELDSTQDSAPKSEGDASIEAASEGTK